MAGAPVRSRTPRPGVVATLLGVAGVVLTLLAVPTNAAGATGAPAAPAAPAVVSAPAGQARQARRADTRPNVVLFLTDDMRTDDLRYMPRTKAIVDAFGMTFRNAVSPHPLCCPARAELLTGQYAQNNGVRHNNGSRGGFRAFDDRRTVGTWFSRAGYRTGYVGKYLNGYVKGSRRSPGWTSWEPLVGAVADYYSFNFYDRPTGKKGYVTTEIRDRTRRMVTDFSASGAPFLMYVNHNAPHKRVTRARGGGWLKLPPPADPETPTYGRLYAGARNPAEAKPSYDRPRPGARRLKRPAAMQELFLARVRALRSVDDAFVDLLLALRDTGELDHTYVVFTSDNGYAVGEHALDTKNQLVREILDVPLLVLGPGVERGGTSAEQVSLVDVPATFLDVAGVRANHRIDGLSLVPLLHGAKRFGRDTTLVQTGKKARPSQRYQGWADRGVQTRRYLYVRDVNHGDEQLYDRRKDPYELHDVSAKRRYARTIAELRRRYEALASCRGARCNRVFGRLTGPR